MKTKTPATTSTAKTAVSFYLPTDLVAEVKIEAIRERVRPTHVVEKALRKHIDARQRESSRHVKT